jgi:proteic killer suppression protein
MRVEYRTKKLKKQCEDPKIAQRDYGSKIGNKLTQRIGELIAANNLLDIQHIPAARLHRLEGKRSDEYAVDLIHPHRLILKPILEKD